MLTRAKVAGTVISAVRSLRCVRRIDGRWFGANLFTLPTAGKVASDIKNILEEFQTGMAYLLQVGGLRGGNSQGW